MDRYYTFLKPLVYLQPVIAIQKTLLLPNWEKHGFQMDAPELTDDFLSIRKQRIKETLSSWKNIAFYFRYTNLQFAPT